MNKSIWDEITFAESYCCLSIILQEPSWPTGIERHGGATAD